MHFVSDDDTPPLRVGTGSRGPQPIRTAAERNEQTRQRMKRFRRRQKQSTADETQKVSDVVECFIAPSKGCRRLVQYQPLNLTYVSHSMSTMFTLILLTFF